MPYVDELRQEYQTRDDVIISPGKFEGEMIYVPYFWNLALEGASSYDEDQDENEEFPVSVFEINATDRENFPGLLDDVETIRVWENLQGFVYCETNP